MTTNPDSSKVEKPRERGLVDVRDFCKYRECMFAGCQEQIPYIEINVPGVAPSVLAPQYCDQHYEHLFGKDEAAEMLFNRNQAEAHQKRIVHEAKWAELCPKKYRTIEEGGETDPLKLSEQARATLNICYGFPKISRPFGLLFHGETDTGKTRVMWRILRKSFDEKKKITVFNGVNFSHLVAEHFRNGTEYRWLESIPRSDVVFFDDLWKFASTERADAELFGIFERCSADGTPIFITTNFTAESILKRAAQAGSRMSVDRVTAIMTRIRQDCEAVTFV